MLIYVKKKKNVFHRTDGRTDGQTDVQLKTIVRNLTKKVFFFIPKCKPNLTSASQPTNASIGSKKRKADVEYSLMLSDSDPESAFFLDDACRRWSLPEKLASNKYAASFVEFLDAKQFNYQYIKTHGFEVPLVFEQKFGLGLRVPSENFKVRDPFFFRFFISFSVPYFFYSTHLF